jgi:hypothetical protein
MARRVTLPSADDLFRPTEAASEATPARPKRGPVHAVHAVPDQPEQDPGQASGRIRHDEKMTVYVTSGELLAIEHARLSLRSRHGLAVDRGRLVREAIALVLADLEQNGEGSALVRQLLTTEE